MTTTVWLYDPNTATYFDISGDVYSVDITRGRSRELDEINAGICRVRVHNQSGDFNPYFLDALSSLLLESGDFLLLEDGSHLLLEAASGATGSYGVMNVGRKLIVADSAFMADAVFTGFVEDFEFEWRPGRFADVTLVAADGLARLARQSFPEWTTTGDQTTGARLVSLLGHDGADINWATGGTAFIGGGVSTLQSNTITNGSNVLGECQKVSRAEQGRFFVDPGNILTFQDRSDVGAGTAACDFNDSSAYANGQTSGKIPFSAVEVTFGSELLYNRVQINVIDGTVQTANNTTSQSNYGLRTLTYSDMLMNSDAQAADLASYLLNRYYSPEAVVSSIRVAMEKLSSTNRATVRAIDIGDTVTLNWTPTSSLGAVSQTLVVEGVGYQKDVDGATWMSFQLSAAPDNYFFILDDATNGKLDTSQVGF